MTPSPSQGHRWPPGATRLLTLGPGLFLLAALSVLDIWVLPASAIIALVVLAPLATALLGSPRDVALIGSLAVAVVALSVIWQDDPGTLIYLYRIAVVAAISTLAVLGARARAQVALDRERFAILAAVGEIADGTRSLADTIAGVNDLVVPTVADICIVDAVNQGEVQRLAVRTTADLDAAVQEALAARPPETGRSFGDLEYPQLVARVDDAALRAIATDEADLAVLRALDANSGVIVPLRARGRRLGSLTLIVTARSGRSYDAGDLEFARVLGGRAALALDNAGLFVELETIEAQLTAALSTLAEAVTVQRTDGVLIYANEVAARMLGFATTQELLAVGVDEVGLAFETTREDGTPLRVDELPGRQVIAGTRAPAPLILRVVERRSGELHWRVAKASGVYDSDDRLKLVVNVFEDITEVKHAELTQRLLASAGELLSSSLNYERTLQQVAELAVPQLADWCVVSMPDGHGHIVGVAVAHVDPAKVALARSIGERYPAPVDAPAGLAAVLRDGKPLLLDEITDEVLASVALDAEHLELLRSIGLRAGLTVPMTAGGKNVGALTLVNSESGRGFAETDIPLAAEIARRAGSAIENARLYTERSSIARTLQTSLLPGRLPRMPGWSSATLYRPAGEQNWVGGDFYDVFAVRGGWCAIVGDVAGRGAAAAALTGLARHTLRTAARLLDDPLAAIGTLNDELLARDVMSLCSVAAVLLAGDEDGRATAELVCAGHPLPLRVRGGAVRPLGSFSPMLGACRVDEWERTTVALEPADVLVLFTDGVFDAVGEDGRFGEDRLEQTLRGATDADDAVARIDAALSAFAVPEQGDDTAVLAVQRAPVAAVAPRPRRASR